MDIPWEGYLLPFKFLPPITLKPMKDWSPGFYCHLFLVKKATGGWRPVIYLPPLKWFICQTQFKMKLACLVIDSIREGDFTLRWILRMCISKSTFIGPLGFISALPSGGWCSSSGHFVLGSQPPPQVFILISALGHSNGICLLISHPSRV